MEVGEGMEFEKVKSILSPNPHGEKWFGVDYNMNLYRGCSHGCIYCDSRSSCYRVFEFDRVRGKKDSIEILERELYSKRKKGIVGMGAMSDPYNPREKKYGLTREALKLIDKYGYGVAIASKSSLIKRDIDILSSISKHSPVIIKISITASSDELSKLIEPNVSLTSERFNILKEMDRNNIYTGLLMMPILPFIGDSEENILNIINLTKKNKGKYIYPYFGVTLRGNQRNWFYNKLDKNFPGIKEKYIENFGDSYSCNSLNQDSLYKIFKNKCEELDISYRMKDIISDYKKKYEIEQISFFD